MSQAAPAIEHAELATLQQLAVDGGLDGEVKVSCSRLAERLDVSTQTASRRLQTLDEQGYIERDLVPDGQWIDLTSAGRTRLRSEYEVYRRLFESKTSVPLRGSVTAGMGEGRHYISLPGYHRQFVDRLGYEPFPGTLNLTLTDESVRRRATIETLEPIDIDGWEDENRTFGPAACYPVTVTAADGTEYESAHAIVPERTHHDDDNLELIAPDKLRDVLDLADGDVLDIILTGVA